MLFLTIKIDLFHSVFVSRIFYVCTVFRFTWIFCMDALGRLSSSKCFTIAIHIEKNIDFCILVVYWFLSKKEMKKIPPSTEIPPAEGSKLLPLNWIKGPASIVKIQKLSPRTGFFYNQVLKSVKFHSKCYRLFVNFYYLIYISFRL
jgi:hypothetical protein